MATFNEKMSRLLSIYKNVAARIDEYNNTWWGAEELSWFTNGVRGWHHKDAAQKLYLKAISLKEELINELSNDPSKDMFIKMLKIGNKRNVRHGLSGSSGWPMFEDKTREETLKYFKVPEFHELFQTNSNIAKTYYETFGPGGEKEKEQIAFERKQAENRFKGKANKLEANANFALVKGAKNLGMGVVGQVGNLGKAAFKCVGNMCGFKGRKSRKHSNRKNRKTRRN